MMVQEYWDDVPDTLVHAISRIARVCHEHGTLSTNLYTWQGGQKALAVVSVGKDNEEIDNTNGVLYSLQTLGFVEYAENTLAVLPEALAFIRYRRRSRFGRWWQRVVRPNATALVGAGITLLATVLTILQIVQVLQALKILS